LKIAGAVMTNFNKICYHSMTEFLTLQNVQTCIWWRCAIVSKGDALYCWVSSRQKKPSRWAAVGTPYEAVIKENCRAVKNTVSSQCAADSRWRGHKHWL